MFHFKKYSRIITLPLLLRSYWIAFVVFAGVFIMTAVKEIWKDVEGWEGLYQVSNIGRVKSFHKKEKILKQNIFGEYYTVCLHRNCEIRTVRVHRLMAIAFLENPENKPLINHKDGNKLNNTSIENIEWCTYSENLQHAFDNRLNKTEKRCTQISKTGEILNSFKSQRDASRKTGISFKHISACINKKRKTAGGYLWH